MAMARPWLFAFVGYTLTSTTGLFTTFLLLFMPSRPLPSKKEMIQSSCTFICISHAFTVGFLYFCLLFLSTFNLLLVVSLSVVNLLLCGYVGLSSGVLHPTSHLDNLSPQPCSPCSLHFGVSESVWTWYCNASMLDAHPHFHTQTYFVQSKLLDASPVICSASPKMNNRYT